MRNTTGQQQEDAETTLHTVLTALRDARPEPGMEDRILERLETLPLDSAAPGPVPQQPGHGLNGRFIGEAGWLARLAAHLPSRFAPRPATARTVNQDSRYAAPEFPGRRPGLTLSALTAAVIVVAILAGQHTRSWQHASAPQARTNSVDSGGQQPGTKPSVVVTPGVASHSTTESASAANQQWASTASRPGAVGKTQRLAPSGDAAQAGAGMGMTPHPRQTFTTEKATRSQTPGSAGTTALQAVSFPAPPMPLTEQERLLLRIAHRNDPIQLALLDPVAREIEAAREHAQFRRFFTPPPLPAELQHEIDKAVQAPYTYAHTEPTPDRTLP